MNRPLLAPNRPVPGRNRPPENARARLGVRIRLHYDTRSDFLDDYTSNTVIGAMFVPRAEPLPVGTSFRLCLEVPGCAKSLDARARVCWVVEPGSGLRPGMGVRFDAPNELWQRRVAGWLRSENGLVNAR